MSDSETREHFELEFRGARFRVDRRPDTPNTYDIEWLNGPSPRLPIWIDGTYGFSTASNSPRPFAMPDFEAAVSEFLVHFYADAAAYFDGLSRAYAIAVD